MLKLNVWSVCFPKCTSRDNNISAERSDTSAAQPRCLCKAMTDEEKRSSDPAERGLCPYVFYPDISDTRYPREIAYARCNCTQCIGETQSIYFSIVFLGWKYLGKFLLFVS